MALEVYGGDVRVIATIEEIERVAGQLRVVSQLARQLLFDPAWILTPNPFHYAAVHSVANGAEHLSHRCEIAKQNYIDVEIGNTSVISRAGDEITHAIEWVAPIATSSPVGALFFGASALSLTAGSAALGFLWGTSPARVESVRSAIGFAPSILGAKSSQGLIARLNTNLAFLGVPTETATTVTPGRVTSSYAAGNLQQHVQRLGGAYSSSASGITIESYQIQGGRQFVVYVPGTQSPAMVGVIPAPAAQRGNPFDVSSNLSAMARPGLAASERGVQLALSAVGAGSRPNDRVLFVGHSQGALISANIASQPQRYQVSGLISVAGPISHLNLKGVPTIALEHNDDPVPALSGPRNPLTIDLVTVRAPSGTNDLISAHAVTGYTNLAAYADSSPDPGLARVMQEMGVAPQSNGSSQQFLLNRTEPVRD